MIEPNQFPHVRDMRVCLNCGQPKDAGLLVCWPCHNDLKMIHDGGYGPKVHQVIETANEAVEQHLRSRICDH